jgi:pimeloyl-ACP methyl ester carboxylesterase
LAPNVVEFLVDQYPEIIGGLDGVPAEARYAANRILIEREIARLEAQIDQISAYQTSRKLWSLDPNQLILWSPVPSLIETAVRRLEERAKEFREWLDEDRQILLFDPVGDGRVAEVFGDLTTASRVGVVVPGMANDIVNFSDAGGGFRANAAQLYGESVSLGPPDVATIAWLGYDTPDGIDATSADAARAGAPALVQLLQGIDPRSDTHVTVVAHSYGSVLAGLAAQEGVEVNDLVFVGSPGTTLDTAADATIRAGGTVWSALATNDPIGAGISSRELLPRWVPPFLAPGWLISDLTIGGAEELWHGPNPVSDEFGAREISTHGCSGHSSYFKATSLLNLARIIQGLYSEVELAD